MIQYFIYGLIPFIISVFFFFIGKIPYFKFVANEPLMETKEFQKCQRNFLLIFLGLDIPVTYVLWKILLFIESFILPQNYLKNSLLNVRPAGQAIPAMILGILFLGKIAEIAMKRIMGPRYELYSYTGNAHFKVNGDRLLWVFGIAILIVAPVFSFQIARMGAYATQEGVVIQEFLSVSTHRYRYDDIKQISVSDVLRAPNGKAIRKTNYQIEFMDGFKWDPNYDEAGKFIDVVAKMSGKEPVKVELLESLPLFN